MKSFHETHNLTLDEVLTKLSVINLRTYNVNVHINTTWYNTFIISNNITLCDSGLKTFTLSTCVIERQRKHNQSAEAFIKSQLHILSYLLANKITSYSFLSQRKSFVAKHAKTYSSIIL
jgi:hypothetical protein